MEYYLKSTPPKRLDVRQPTEIAEWRQNNNNNRVEQSLCRSLTEIPRAEDKGKGILEELRDSGGIKCYKCKGMGHFLTQCPTKEPIRTLIVDTKNPVVEGTAKFEEDIYDPNFVIEPEDYKDSMDINDGTCLTVIRCQLAQPRTSKDWRRSSIFHTFTKCGNAVFKVLVDRESCINVVSA
ncbi:hypothetical protein LWI29_003576 [Acer saccharum]|uniref:CCHC-type domain-containing protein n=1 Tax=Acer saccharum TaxID=4024 RepID=A0AA39SR18_ACESA|nr:hypothetical protein LWI29_003576 [Acer saccharum]